MPPQARLCMLVCLFCHARISHSGSLTNLQLREKVHACSAANWRKQDPSCFDMANWDTSLVTDMSALFQQTPGMNEDISRWNTAAVEDMSFMFDCQEHKNDCPFNGDLSRWDTGKLVNAERMFRSCASFNGNLSSWDVQSLTMTKYMFYGAYVFNTSLSNWDVSSVTDAEGMFWGTTLYNDDLSRWNLKSMTNVAYLFAFTESFNGDISTWDVSHVRRMKAMFYYSQSFNHDISRWDVRSVTGMHAVFSFSVFNQPIGQWDVSRVTSLAQTFENALHFNRDLSRWNIGAVRSFGSTFEGCPAFNGNISTWNIGVSAVLMSRMFANTQSFNQDLSRWNFTRVWAAAEMFENARAFNQNLSTWEQNLRGLQIVVGTGDTLEEYVSSMLRGSPKLSLSDVNECVTAQNQGLKICNCTRGQSKCVNTVAGFDCECISFPLHDSCPANEVVLRYASTAQVSCGQLAAGCRGLAEYTCSASAEHGEACAAEFKGLERLCQEEQSLVVPVHLRDFVVAQEHELRAQDLSLLVQTLHLDHAKFDADIPVRVRVELEATTKEEEQWLCGGEPNDHFYVFGDEYWSRAMPMIYLGVSTFLSVLSDGVINLREALRHRELAKVAVVLVEVVLEVIGATLLVSGIDTVQIGQEVKLSGWCHVTGRYAGMDFEFGQLCGGLQTASRIGVAAKPVCVVRTIVPTAALYVGCLDILLGLVVVVWYGQNLWGGCHRRRGRQEDDDDFGTTRAGTPSLREDPSIHHAESSASLRRWSIRPLLAASPARSPSPKARSPPARSCTAGGLAAEHSCRPPLLGWEEWGSERRVTVDATIGHSQPSSRRGSLAPSEQAALAPALPLLASWRLRPVQSGVSDADVEIFSKLPPDEKPRPPPGAEPARICRFIHGPSSAERESSETTKDV